MKISNTVWCTYYNDNLYYENWERRLEESSEMAVFRFLKQQHEVYISVASGSHLMLEKRIIFQKESGKAPLCVIKNGEKKLTHNERLT